MVHMFLVFMLKELQCILNYITQVQVNVQQVLCFLFLCLILPITRFISLVVMNIVVAIDLLEHVPLGLESSDPLPGTGGGDRGSNRGESGSRERGAGGVLQSGLGLLECIGDQLHSSSEGLLHGGEGGDLVIGEGEGRGGHNVSADSHNHGAGGEVSSNGHNCGDEGDEGGSISCSSSLATSKSSDLPAGSSDASHGGSGSIHGGLTLGQSRSLGLQSISRDRAGSHGGDSLVLKLPAGGESVLASLQTLGDGGHLGDLAVLDSLASHGHLRCRPAGTGLGGGGLLAHGHTFSGQSLEQICGIDTGVHKGHVGHGEVSGAGGVHQNLAVKQSAGQVGQLQGAFRGSRAGAGESRLVATTKVHQLEGDGSKHRLLARLLASNLRLFVNPLLLFLKVGHNILPSPHGGDSTLKTHTIYGPGRFPSALVVLPVFVSVLPILPVLSFVLLTLSILPVLPLVLILPVLLTFLTLLILPCFVFPVLPFLQSFLCFLVLPLLPLPLPQSLPLLLSCFCFSKSGYSGGCELLREAAVFIVLSGGENSDGNHQPKNDQTELAVHVPSQR